MTERSKTGVTDATSSRITSPSLPMRLRQSRPRILPQSFDNSRYEFLDTTGCERRGRFGSRIPVLPPQGWSAPPRPLPVRKVPSAFHHSPGGVASPEVFLPQQAIVPSTFSAQAKY